MVKDLLESSGNCFENEKVVLDTYKLQNGMYYLFSKSGELINKLEVVKDSDATTDIYDYFKERDYYSNYIDSNKAVENKVKVKVDNIEYSMNKKICSNNYLTLFFKNKFIKELNELGTTKSVEDKAIPVSIFRKGIEEYFNALENLGSQNKKGEKEILESIKDIIADKEKIYSNKENIIKAFDIVIEDLIKIKEIKKDIWIKIFTEADLLEYEIASNKYIALKLFNTNSNNTYLNEIIYGINNYNFGLNAKKPFLELKSTPYKVGLIEFNEIKKIRNLYTWLLKNVSQKRNGYVIIPKDYNYTQDLEVYMKNGINNKEVFLLRVTNDNGSAKIENFEIIPNYNTKIKRFECEDYLKTGLDQYINIVTENINVMENFISQIWFSKYLQASYYTFKDSVSSSKISEWKKGILERYANLFKELFIKQDAKMFIKKLDEIGEKIVIESLREELPELNRNHFINTRKSMNLWIALDKYFKNKEGGIEMELTQVVDNARDIIKNQGKIKDDKTYYYILGQVAYYLINLSKANKPTLDLLDPIIKQNNDEKLKENLIYLCEKYNHEIELKNLRFKNSMSQVLLYKPTESVKNNKKLILAGILSKSMFFESNKIEKEEEVIDGNEE